MALVRTSLINGIAVIARMLSLLGINKVVAIYTGPVGYALVGQYYNAVQLITTFASGAVNTGLVRYTAEHGSEPERQKVVWRTAGSIALIGSLTSALIITLAHRPLASYFLRDPEMGSVFLWLAGSLVFFVFNAYLTAILNGKKELRRYVIANITGSFMSLLLTAWLGMTYGLFGALVALSIYQSVTFFATFALCLGTSWFDWRDMIGRIDPSAARNLFQYALMALASAICAPVGHILIRTHLGNTMGWEYAGYWEAMWKLSMAYLLLVTSSLSVYYLPRLSELRGNLELRQEIFHCLKHLVPFTMVCGVFIFLFRLTIINVLFTQAFEATEVMFAWQLVGDTFKILSWALAYVMLAKSMVREYVATEVLAMVSFYFLTRVLTATNGLEGAAMAHAGTYFIYTGAVYLVLRRRGILP